MTALSLLLLIGLFSTAGAVMAYYFLKNPDLLLPGSAKAKPDKAAIHLTFQGGEFLIPGYLVSRIKRSPLRVVKKINLTIPLGWTVDNPARVFDDSSTSSQWIFATIDKPDSTLSLVKRLRKIYRHYITAPASRHHTGLYNYQFKASSPYSNLELFTDNLQSPTLFIRCEIRKSALGIKLCSRTITISDKLELRYSFTRSQLGNWQQVHQTMKRLLGTIYRAK